jgi:hypothetical protein
VFAAEQAPITMERFHGTATNTDNSAMESIFENFCSMVVEEYLMKKNLTATLDTLRSEWQRPSEVSAALLEGLVLMYLKQFYVCGL